MKKMVTYKESIAYARPDLLPYWHCSNLRWPDERPDVRTIIAIECLSCGLVYRTAMNAPNHSPLRQECIGCFYGRMEMSCKECGSVFLRFYREPGDEICPRCRQRQKSLLVQYEGLIEQEWYTPYNGLLGVSPGEITDRYPHEVYWQCPQCKNVYRMAPGERIENAHREKECCTVCRYGRSAQHPYTI